MIEKTRFEFQHGHYHLERESDGAGDTGGMLNAVWLDENGDVQSERNVLELGKACQVGSLFARTNAKQDWWLTTPITRFLQVDEEKNEFLFQTGNSVYIFRAR